jgi:hypothetical protein
MPRSPTELRQTLRPTQTRRTGIKVDVAFWTSFCSPVKICAFSMQADGAADRYANCVSARKTKQQKSAPQ